MKEIFSNNQLLVTSALCNIFAGFYDFPCQGLNRGAELFSLICLFTDSDQSTIDWSHFII